MDADPGYGVAAAGVQERLAKVVKRAAGEGRRFEQLRTEMSVTDAWGQGVAPLQKQPHETKPTYLIAATGPTPESPHGTLLDKLGRSLVSPVITASAILQLYCLRSFVGGYKMCVGKELLKVLAKVCWFWGLGGVWRLEVRDVTGGGCGYEGLAGFLDAWGKSGSGGW